MLYEAQQICFLINFAILQFIAIFQGCKALNSSNTYSFFYMILQNRPWQCYERGPVVKLVCKTKSKSNSSPWRPPVTTHDSTSCVTEKMMTSPEDKKSEKKKLIKLESHQLQGTGRSFVLHVKIRVLSANTSVTCNKSDTCNRW